MLFFINSALVVRPRQVYWSKVPKRILLPARLLGACPSKYIEARSITPPLAGAPLCSALGRVCWSIYQRSARMGLCKKSS